MPANESHCWSGQTIGELSLPFNVLALMIEWKDQVIACKGDTKIEAEDDLILSIPESHNSESETLREIDLKTGHPWIGKPVSRLHLDSKTLIAPILRGDETITPDGNTLLKENDCLVILDGEEKHRIKKSNIETAVKTYRSLLIETQVSELVIV